MCFFWGTTYLAIRIAVETFPPLLLVGVRFFVSGVILLTAARVAKLPMPSAWDWLNSAIFGLLMLGVGNTTLSYAETRIPSGIAAVFITTTPFWMVGLEAIVPGGERLRLPTVAGLLIGLAGAVLLIGPDALTTGFRGDRVWGFVILQFSCVSWSVGSIILRRRGAHVNAVVSGAIQQLAVGAVFLPLALGLGQRPTEWSARGVWSIVYLVIFGSIVGYTSYVYALHKLPVAILTIHTYVNPVVASALGWLVLAEAFGWREAAGMAIIFGGVAVVKAFNGHSAPPQPPVTPGVNPSQVLSRP